MAKKQVAKKTTAKKKTRKRGVLKTASKAAPRKVAGSAIVYVEIPAPDMKAMQAFYREVFGWKITDLEPAYAMFSTPTVGGGFVANMDVADKGVCIYLTVDDIPATLATVAEKGGSVLARKTKISDEYGFYGIFKDPCGNRLGVWSQK